MNTLVVGLLAGSIGALLLGLGLGFKLGIPVGEQRGLEAAKFAKSFGVGQPDWADAYRQQMDMLAKLAPSPNYGYGYAPSITASAPLSTIGGGGAGGYNLGAGGYSPGILGPSNTLPTQTVVTWNTGAANVVSKI